MRLDLRKQALEHMPVLPAFDPAMRRAAEITWRGRMINEYCSAEVFETLAKQLEAAGAPADRAERCRAFAAEERLHGVLCGAVVQALGGQALADLPEQEPVPTHPEVSPLEGVLRNLIHISCMSETVAVALIGAERLEMPEGPLRELLTQIYADECGHANFGWRLVGELIAQDPSVIPGLNEYLLLAFAHLEQHELAHLPEGARATGPELGLCDGRDARELFYAAVQNVIVPGLDSHGLSASWAWENRALALEN
ncbi:MAG: hypothetical protein ACI9VR_003639 [Cognaticolwellia sp.]|jgi:hypothetical protein